MLAARQVSVADKRGALLALLVGLAGDTKTKSGLFLIVEDCEQYASAPCGSTC